MKKTEELQERSRKARSKNGERGQKMMSFRVDNENAVWLTQQANKGRYINDLIAADRERQLGTSKQTT